MKFPFQLREGCEFDAVGFGTNAVDYLVSVPQYPEFNTKVEFTEFSRLAGGEAASTMVGLQRLGCTAAYAGRFGSDDEGAFGLASLIDEGVDIRFAETIVNARTQLAFILIDERSGERTILWRRDTRLAYSVDDAPIGAAGLGKVLHLTPHDTFASIAMAREARAHGTIVTIDIDNIFEGIDELLPLVDVLLGSRDFFEKLLGPGDEETALKTLVERHGCKVVGVTLGAEGSVVLANNTFIQTPAFKVPGGCVDTTGAGDAFRAGFLFGVLTGKSVENAAYIANAVAALKCRSMGARTALPDITELQAM